MEQCNVRRVAAMKVHLSNESKSMLRSTLVIGPYGTVPTIGRSNMRMAAVQCASAFKH